MPIQKCLYILWLVGVVLSSGCSTVAEYADYVPGVYKLEIDQGNVISREMVDQLRPHMTKRQVKFIMGSPLLVDVFHQERWDYIYSEQQPGEAREQTKLSLFFEGDNLVGVQGDYRPTSTLVEIENKESMVDVPKRVEDKTLWQIIRSWFGFEEA